MPNGSKLEVYFISFLFVLQDKSKTHERISKDAVLLENGKPEWQVLLCNPFLEFFVSVLWLAVVGDGVLQQLSCVMICHFGKCE